MRIDLGTDVFGSDGEKVGSVERIVVDSNTKDIHQFIVHRGFLTPEDKLVDIDMISSQDADGIRLDLTSDQVNELPDYIEERFIQVPEHDQDAIPFIIPSAMGAGAYLYGAPNIGRGYEGSSDSFFDAAPTVAPVIEDESNIAETDVMISEGTDVYGADGNKVGSVDEILVGNDGSVNGFIVSKGFIFKKEVRIPIDWVESADGSEIRLNVTSTEAETGAFDIEESTL